MKRTFAAGYPTSTLLKALLFLAVPLMLAVGATPRLEAANHENSADYDETQGDFILGFREVGSNSSILVDLGPITSFTATKSFSLGSLGSLLAATYGSDWATNTNVYFSLAATDRPQDGTTTVNYVTSPEYPADGVPATVWPRLTQSNSNILRNKITSCGDDFNTFTVQSGTNAVLEPSTSPDAYQNYMPGGSTDTGHATSGNIAWGFFNPTTEGDFSEGTAGVVLHLIQLVPGRGPGTDLGVFKLSSDGNTLTFTISPPVITSATTATATEGQAFTYQITASGNPTSYGVQGLPSGLTANATTGLISGTPKGAGKVTLTLNAYNSAGKGSATLTLTILAAVPTITSALTATGEIGDAFSYQITASNQPTSYGVQGLPAGFAVNTKTGLITGTPKGAGKVNLTLNVYNSVGKGSATLTLTITAAVPTITSALTASGVIGQAFSYQITASNQPTSFGVQGLPAGFAVDTKTGLITGTPKGAGKVNLTLNVYNSVGKGSATLVLTITAN